MATDGDVLKMALPGNRGENNNDTISRQNQLPRFLHEWPPRLEAAQSLISKNVPALTRAKRGHWPAFIEITLFTLEFSR
ncbi:hypothetical protein [Polaromonas naphthalenivorans]|uniref:hypothetical protein n=1 Tax=Polaromonas naphthalenivorans TaxID=216465 RepID=UPI0012EEDBA0|nr:hypothetical protein [Polaromonas naphthalenivorans]